MNTMNLGYHVLSFDNVEAMLTRLNGFKHEIPDNWVFNIKGVWGTPAGIHVLILCMIAQPE